MTTLLLASSSIYRKELLARLKLPFITFSPDVDESRLTNESLPNMALRLAALKAQTAAKLHPNTICIGSDEIGVLNDTVLGKPGSHANAVAQLQQMSGQKIYFHTAVCVAAPHLSFEATELVTTAVKFRSLSLKNIENYLKKEQPYQSAGSFKSETLGSALIEYFEGSDPTALIGLPLIKLCDLLKQAGVEII